MSRLQQNSGGMPLYFAELFNNLRAARAPLCDSIHQAPIHVCRTEEKFEYSVNVAQEI